MSTAAVLSVATVALMAAHRLYLARTCSVRSVELARVARCSALTALVAGWLNRTHGVGPSLTADVLGAALAVVAIGGLRGCYRSWLRGCRTRNRYCRNVCVLGSNDEAEALVRVFHDQVELGYRVVAVLGDPADWILRGTGVPAVRPGRNPADAARRVGASGIVVAVSAFSASDLERVVRQLVSRGIHVQVSTGLRRVGYQRMSMLSLSHQPLFYIERPRHRAWQSMVKRALDVAVASVALLLSAPLLLAATLAIKFDDGGAILYRQERVGRDGKPFKVLKFRTMVPDASAQLSRLTGLNERSGPLFKLSDDPRVTRAGRTLRSTSVDELPQLINVLKGEMSLVGPRPALPSEVVQFDPELRERVSVAPGITGLWQIEARDNPSFDAYRRLDLFYVDNWSIGMDLSILVATAGVVISGAVRTLRGGGEEVRTIELLQPRDRGAALINPLLSSPASDSGAVGR